MTTKEIFETSNFNRIVNFYVFSCPVKNKNGKVCCNAMTFEQLGYSRQSLIKLLKFIKTKLNNRVCFEEILSLHPDLNLKNKNYEIISCVEKKEIGKTKTIFYLIRNAFAHGQFDLISKTYILSPSKNGKPKGFIRLKEKTLLEIIEVVKGGLDNGK